MRVVRRARARLRVLRRRLALAELGVPGGGLRAQLTPALGAEEGHQHQARHVERRQARGEQRGPAEQPAPDQRAPERGLDDEVLRVEAGQEREADQREVAEGERCERDRHVTPQPAEAAHVGLVGHPVHHRPGAEEEPGLEEAVGEQVREAGRVADGPEPHGQHHVADLADRGVRQHLLDVVVGAADDRADQQRDRPDDRHHELAGRGDVVERVGARDQVDPGGDHGGRVDERRDRVGPSMASGSQACSGNWPDLPHAPRGAAGDRERAPGEISPARAKTSVYCVVPSWVNRMKIASASPTSPTRFMRNAFFAALPAAAARCRSR